MHENQTDPRNHSQQTVEERLKLLNDQLKQKRQQENSRSTMRSEAGVEVHSTVAIGGVAAEDDRWMLGDGSMDSS